VTIYLGCQLQITDEALTNLFQGDRSLGKLCMRVQVLSFAMYHAKSRDSSVGIATGYGLNDQGEREFESR
jgi:hypothetical protein